MTPEQRYQQDLQRADFFEDAAQRRAVQALQALYTELVASEQEQRAAGLVQRVLGRFLAPEPVPVRGLYMWGGVGRGKTYLMDIFFDALPFERKLRAHFHRFMRRVHQELKSLAGQKNPLELVASRLAEEARVICFDEFFVTDITDAMILAGLFEQLFQRGVTLVATSNIAPDDLYRDGLQRSRFLPAIALIKQHTAVMNVDGGTDYRLRVLEQAELYYTPLGEGAERSLAQAFAALNPDAARVARDVELEVEGRRFLARAVADDVVWFDFTVLCGGPRSQNDYIELAREYQTVLISDIPVLGQGKDDQSRRFINLVDEFYDRNVKLVLSAAAPLDQLYPGGRLSFEFGRTRSRLLEMQSHDYLTREHRP